MTDSVKVYRYQNDSSDKIWAIDTAPNVDGTHTAWWGRYGSKLQSKCLPADPYFWERISSKENKGYVAIPDVTVDPDSCELTSLSETVSSNDMPSTLWYRISKQVSIDQVREFLDTTVTNLAQEDSDAANKLVELDVFKSLYKGNLNGGAEYQEGPMGILLLFALRRRFDCYSTYRDAIQLADDNINVIPESFDDIGSYIEESMIASVSVAALEWQATSSDKLDAVKQLAIAMGCIEAPINLAVIQTDTKAAFF